MKIKEPLKVVFDSSNGSTGPVLHELFDKNKNIKATFINDKPDGNFTAHGPNPIILGTKKQLQRAVVKNKADFGVIFDADGDRIFFVDNKGRDLDTDIIFVLLSSLFKEPYLVDTSLGSVPLRWLKQGLKIKETRTGHYFIKKEMKRRNIEFACEQSGHYYFKYFFFTDSGIMAAIFTINQISKMKSKKFSLSEWIDNLPYVYTGEGLNLKTTDPKDFINRVKKLYPASKFKMSQQDGFSFYNRQVWINIRASNTEPLVRVRLKGKDEAAVKHELIRIKNAYKFR
jgi:phosphomannomutase